MFDSTDPNPDPASALDPGVAHQLPADAYYELVRTLRLTLPPPLTGSAEDLARRDRAAIARVAALVPADAAEADLAAQFVAASEQWKDCLRLAQAPETTPEWAGKCRAQALGMMRQANGALRLLLRVQQVRRKLDADAAAADRLAWTEHCALGFMAEALSAQGRPEKSGGLFGDADQPTPEATAPAEAEQIAAAETPAGRDEAEAELAAAAERYAATYPERAAQIRRTGRLPHDVRYFCPPEATLARALMTAHTPALAALDSALPQARAA